MRPVPAQHRRWTRRALLAAGVSQALPAVWFSSDWRRYSDPATELEVLRLTDPAYSSFLPAYYNRFLSRHNTFLLFWSDRTGSPQVFRMDLKTGEYRQLTQAEALDGSSITLMPDERSFCFFDGPVLRNKSLNSLKEREIYRVPADWQISRGGSISEDGTSAVFVETRNGVSRLRWLSMTRGSGGTIAEAPWPMAGPVVRPRHRHVLYRQGDEALWMVDSNGRQNRKLKVAAGVLGPARWSPDGRTVLYLNYPADHRQLNSIREYAPDDDSDRLVSRTSQFAHFSSNRDTSVFVGASRNKNSPHVLILLRKTRRELTLCEHRASDPAMVAPQFSADSQKIYFQSDRNGKPALYRVPVERFVEKTEPET